MLVVLAVHEFMLCSALSRKEHVKFPRIYSLLTTYSALSYRALTFSQLGKDRHQINSVLFRTAIIKIYSLQFPKSAESKLTQCCPEQRWFKLTQCWPAQCWFKLTRCCPEQCLFKLIQCYLYQRGFKWTQYSTRTALQNITDSNWLSAYSNWLSAVQNIVDSNWQIDSELTKTAVIQIDSVQRSQTTLIQID